MTVFPRLWVLVVSAVLLGGAITAQAACKRNEHGVFEDGACASEALSKANKELDEVYTKLLARADEGARKKLQASQRLWVEYRDANAAFVYAMEGNGSAGRMVAANQMEQAARARMSELRSWLP